MTDHLPVLQVVIPLLAAPLCALVRRGRIAWGIALAASWVVGQLHGASNTASTW